ncbi:MAG: hypothetical protein U1F87_00475 [Kiritimatiellia bacterium]
MTDPAATAALAEALPKLAQPARGWLTAALADLGGAPALAALQQELASGDPEGKLAAANALRRRGEAATATALAAALRGADLRSPRRSPRPSSTFRRAIPPTAASAASCATR